jgi:hypothetical protein
MKYETTTEATNINKKINRFIPLLPRSGAGMAPAIALRASFPCLS